MNDIEKLLLKAAKQGLAELSKQGIGLYDEKCEKGIYYIFNGKTYLISVKEEED